MKKTTLLLVSIMCALICFGQSDSESFVDEAAMAVEKMISTQGDPPIAAFVSKYMNVEEGKTPTTFINKVKKIRKEMSGLNDDVGVSINDQGLVLMMASGEREQRVLIVLDQENKKIEDLVLLVPPARIDLTKENLDEVIQKIEEDGMSGVIYVHLDGKDLIKKGFGKANLSLDIPNSVNTVFGTGSRPIDYTVAAILLLDQKGSIQLDDPIKKYFSNVPDDKAKITIRHLMIGQSGLPDFFHTEHDWDPDLQWIDRNTAVKRIFDQELIFIPGTERRHSHGAFGLLAALIEIVSGKTYYGFIRHYFLDPAGMERTGEYGETRNLQVGDFAVGSGPSVVGLPNIPPNWGPTSWLIKGSGGMYSTLGDLPKFYAYVRSGQVLDKKHNQKFRRATANVDGSDRGFELFNIYEPGIGEAYLFLNVIEDMEKARQLMRGLERLVARGG